MKCTKCNSDVADDAFYCGSCGHELAASARCQRCRHPVIPDSNFCVACGVRHHPEIRDDSFLEYVFKSCLKFIRTRGLSFTHVVMRLLPRLVGVAEEEDGWAGEELAYLLGLFITYCMLALACVAGSHLLFAWVLVAYAAYRLVDILSYELEIVFMDRHKDLAKSGGHLLSVDRRILCLFIHLLDFIGCYALLFLAIAALQPGAFSGELTSPIDALYFSVIVASFTGLSSVTPVLACARLAVISEIVLNLVLFSIVFATVVGSLGHLTEMRPRPPRAPRIFGRAKPSRGA